MINLTDTGVYVHKGRVVKDSAPVLVTQAEARRGTIVDSILRRHNTGGESDMRIRFDALASHDITYVNVIQTARAAGIKRFPVPYVLTNCHNSLCAIGGTINEDDHQFGLSAAKKYGGIYVPPHMAVIHQVMRERFAGCGKMILGTDSHTRYGALGTLGVGEGGGEMVKQLLAQTWDINQPEVVCVYLTGKPSPGVGPHDVALALVGATFSNGFVKNRILEFMGDGVLSLSMDFRNSVDVMTTETTCLSSVWITDEKTRQYLDAHNRADDFSFLAPAEWAYYDRLIEIDLSSVKPMIALPFHPGNVYSIQDLNANLGDILRMVEVDAKNFTGRDISFTSKIKNGCLQFEQGVIAGCAGGSFESIMAACDIIGRSSLDADVFSLSVYPASQPIMLELMRQKALYGLTRQGAVIRSAFCGPCFGAGDIPSNNGLSARHTTRNFPFREGSRPGDGQFASVALMDARSIAATAANGGRLTAASTDYICPKYVFDESPYRSRIFNGWGSEEVAGELVYGPNIVDWPLIPKLSPHLLLKIVAYIDDPVTTTDELIPSGETSSYRSNPLKLAEFTLSRKTPNYVRLAKEVQLYERAHSEGDDVLTEQFEAINRLFPGVLKSDIAIASAIYAVKPGDGSAREQAASCQRVLGGGANIALEYATKRYRSNLINWGILPFIISDSSGLSNGDWIFVPNIIEVVAGSKDCVAYNLTDMKEIELGLGALTEDEKRILTAGCLINDYRESSHS